jgi:hypothetical protein
MKKFQFLKVSFWAVVAMGLFCCLPVIADEHGGYKKTGTVNGEIRSAQYFKDRVELEIYAPDAMPIGEKAHVGFTATLWTDEVSKGGAGRYQDRGAVLLTNGTINRFYSNGIWKRLTQAGESNHRWIMKTLGVLSDGGTYFATCIFDQKSMTSTCDVHETNLPG